MDELITSGDYAQIREPRAALGDVVALVFALESGHHCQPKHKGHSHPQTDGDDDVCDAQFKDCSLELQSLIHQKNDVQSRLYAIDCMIKTGCCITTRSPKSTKNGALLIPNMKRKLGAERRALLRILSSLNTKIKVCNAKITATTGGEGVAPTG